jgi:hypothetical protein
MIRVYLDWNVFSNLKLKKYAKQKEFLLKHKDKFLIPYSPAHFTDIMKSFSPQNEKFYDDLKTLTELSDNHLMQWDGTFCRPYLKSPIEYFDIVKGQKGFEDIDIQRSFNELDKISTKFGLPKVGKFIIDAYKDVPLDLFITDNQKNLAENIMPGLDMNGTFWDLFKNVGQFTASFMNDKEYIKKVRGLLNDSDWKLESNSGNWSYDEVIANVDEFLKSKGQYKSFLEMIKSMQPPNKNDLHNLYFMSYWLLDMIGYKTDSLPKPTDNPMNIYADVEHSFYAGHCDFLIADDKKLRTKSKVLYHEFNVNTEIITLGEMTEVLESRINNIYYPKALDVDAFFYLQNTEGAKNIDTEDENIKLIYIPLNKPYLNFFTHLIYRLDIKKRLLALQYSRIENKLSTITYFTEIEKLVDNLERFFSSNDKERFEQAKLDYVYKRDGKDIVWKLKNGEVQLTKDEKSSKPILLITLQLED